MSALWRDLRQAARALRSNPGLVALATLSLALGIGANVTVFAWARAILLEPFPGVRDQGRLVKVAADGPPAGVRLVLVSRLPRPARPGARRSPASCAVRQTAATLGATGRASAPGSRWCRGTSSRFSGVEAALGRTLAPADDRVPEGHPVVVIGHALWQRRFGGDPGVVGRTVLLNTRPYTVVGVAPARFRGAGTGLVFDAWVPMMMQMQFEPGGSRLESRGNRWLDVYARLAPGVSLEQAQAELGRALDAHRRAEPARDARARRRALPAVARPAQRRRDPRPDHHGARRHLRPGAAARLRQPREPAARARRQPAPGDRDPPLARGAARRRGCASCSSRACCSRCWAARPGSSWPPSGSACSRPGRRRRPSRCRSEREIDGGGDRRRGRRRAPDRARSSASCRRCRPPGRRRPTRCATRPPRVTGGRTRLRSGLVVAQVALSVLLLVAAGLFLRTLQRLQSTDLGFEPGGRAGGLARALHERLRPRARLRVLPRARSSAPAPCPASSRRASCAGCRSASAARARPRSRSTATWPPRTRRPGATSTTWARATSA